VPFLYSSRKPSELSPWFCHDDSTVNIVMVIIIITLLSGSFAKNVHFTPSRETLYLWIVGETSVNCNIISGLFAKNVHHITTSIYHSMHIRTVGKTHGIPWLCHDDSTIYIFVLIIIIIIIIPLHRSQCIYFGPHFCENLKLRELSTDQRIQFIKLCHGPTVYTL